ncbi:hypothetical protein TSOC_010737 [Tetrabaena socialis]|uniref:VHS domain-containing protein n=1 Tax=Tetrabaena socialis TaxID=47790 RepID=A0A2J7ZSH8_9CHLO|nr:hypothetical protein TSOC_010737 [Tetrabaena socialis]|eukprot:PNH03229.1 hypothetical protein TSOC_010737 [Tetrabaena socialis]
MASKIKEGLRDITQGVKDKLMGPKYAGNAFAPVVETINQDIANGKDGKEIIGLLRRRLRTDNPHKQWLAVNLVSRVLRDCSALGYQEELLQEVARTMARPAKPDSDAGKVTRQAAKELLRGHGRAGTSAFRAVNRHNLEAVSNAAQHAAAAAQVSANSESASVVAEVQMLIDQAHANTELLSEMLIMGQAAPERQGGSAAAGSADEFENELTRDLITEVGAWADPRPAVQPPFPGAYGTVPQQAYAAQPQPQQQQPYAYGQQGVAYPAAASHAAVVTTVGSNNPFNNMSNVTPPVEANTSSALGGSSSVDAEWAVFFAGRTAGGAQ